MNLNSPSSSNITPNPWQVQENGFSPLRPGGSLSKQRKHVTSACHACKTGKVKCDGNVPCMRCVGKNITCVYRSEEDGRSRVPTKRKIEQLQHDNAVLRGLVDELGDADDQQVRRAIGLIRSNASLSEVRESLTQAERATNSELRRLEPLVKGLHAATGSVIPPSSSKSSLTSEPVNRVLSVNRLVDEPLYLVPAAPWTSVSSDDHLVSHLVSLWVTWDHLFPDGLTLDLFLRDMRSGNPDAIFCSPFLVNSILATGCLHSDYGEAKTSHGVASGLSNRFIREAKQLLEQVRSTPSVATVQGLTILYTAVSKLGRDGDGYNYAVQASAMCAELMRARDRIIRTASSSEVEKEIAFALDVTCWGTYACTAASSMGWMRPQTISQPKHPWPNISTAFPRFSDHEWSPYPRVANPQNLYREEVLQGHNKLAILTSDMTKVIYGDMYDSNLESKAVALNDVYIRLETWRTGLPEFMKRDSIESPAVLLMLSWWHGVVLSLLRAKMQIQSQANQQKESRSDAGVELYTPDDASARSLALHSDHSALIQHAADIIGLVRIYRTVHDYSRMNCCLCHPIYLALYVVLENNIDGRYDYDITELCTALSAGGQRFPLVFTILRMVQLDVRQRGLKLPTMAEMLFRDVDVSNAAPGVQWELPNSMYPSPQSVINPTESSSGHDANEFQPKNMREFMEMFGDLDMVD